MQAQEKFKFDFKHACTHRFNIKKNLPSTKAVQRRKRGQIITLLPEKMMNEYLQGSCPSNFHEEF